MVVELAKAGDLRGLYTSKTTNWQFETGLRIVATASKGLAYMHSMPIPVVHRDVKSLNVMVMEDGVTGKLGDCGESRRVALDSTMTRTGSPLWAAPELLAGKRYCEDVDTFSFGVVLFEIAAKQLPYGIERGAHKKAAGNSHFQQLLRKIAVGDIKIELKSRFCRKHGVPGSFVKRMFVFTWKDFSENAFVLTALPKSSMTVQYIIRDEDLPWKKLLVGLEKFARRLQPLKSTISLTCHQCHVSCLPRQMADECHG